MYAAHPLEKHSFSLLKAHFEEKMNKKVKKKRSDVFNSFKIIIIKISQYAQSVASWVKKFKHKIACQMIS